MYLIFLGNENIINKIINKLNSEKEDKNEKNKKYIKINKNIYVKHEISEPCIDLLDDKCVDQILLDDAIKTINNKYIDKKSNSKNNLNNDKSINLDIYKKYIVMDEGIETAHCLTYADLSSNSINNLHYNSNEKIETY